MGERFERGKFEKLAGPFSEWPALLCPLCSQITLEPEINEFESATSAAARNTDDWDPTDASGFFYGELKCPRTPCGNRYVVAGSWTYDWGPANVSGSEEDPYLVAYKVKHILPELPLIELPDGAPAGLQPMISAASASLLSDPSASANRIRSAIDCILDHKGVRKFPQGNRKKRLTTHARIELFRDKNPSAADQLMAMKWIGNVGSHESEVMPLAWVLDGIEHFAKAVEIVYDTKEKELMRRAAIINKKGGKLRATTSNLVR
ncbi:DUF4145 domain-containing protein [Streptomyces blattellae]|uniref:DUF4145 domain-containing protein n=1 Tax=Streptomyces blattellae TaxID=2569855 RepID=UPI0012B7FC9F|nr:DUF4145 domain-containing protein [Streptomyces blattellae]